MGAPSVFEKKKRYFRYLYDFTVGEQVKGGESILQYKIDIYIIMADSFRRLFCFGHSDGVFSKIRELSRQEKFHSCQRLFLQLALS